MGLEAAAFRLSTGEARLVQAAADALGLSRSAFVRGAVVTAALEAALRADPADRHEREGDAQAAALKAALAGFAGTEKRV